jgi:hypothetical protein
MPKFKKNSNPIMFKRSGFKMKSSLKQLLGPTTSGVTSDVDQDVYGDMGGGPMQAKAVTQGKVRVKATGPGGDTGMADL